MITLNQLGKNLKKIRDGLGLSQEFVAKELNLSRQAIISIESGKRKIDSFELFNLARLYNADPDQLMSDNVPLTSSFQEAVLHLRKKQILDEDERKGLLEFQSICDDYQFLKSLYA